MSNQQQPASLMSLLLLTTILLATSAAQGAVLVADGTLDASSDTSAAAVPVVVSPTTVIISTATLDVVPTTTAPLTNLAGTTSAPLGALEPQDNTLLFGVWYDRPNGDSPVAVNSRINYKPLSFFQVDIDISGNKSETPPSATDQMLVQLLATNSSADAFLTVYPFLGFANVSSDQLTDLMNRVNALVQSGRNVFVRYAPEMNGGWFAYGQRPKEFIESWKKVYTTIKQGLGPLANKVAFIWSPNSGHNYPWPDQPYAVNVTKHPEDVDRMTQADWNGDGKLDNDDDPYQPYYPGDDVVDWVGMSIYHYGTSYPWYQNVVPPSGEFQSFITGTNEGDTGRFPFYNSFSSPFGCKVSKGNKPFFVSETAAAFHYAWDPNKTHDPSFVLDTTSVSRVAIKQAWWQQVFDPQLYINFPKIKGVCFFEFVKPEEITLRDFTAVGAPPNGFDEDAGVLQAFQTDLPQFADRIVWASSVTNVVASTTSSSQGSTVSTSRLVSMTSSSSRSSSSGGVGDLSRVSQMVSVVGVLISMIAAGMTVLCAV